MKTILKISILLNLGLLGGLIFFLVREQKQVSVLPVAAETKPAADERIATAPHLVQPEPKPFRWSQLDAADYHVYVKNLRAIGCPEPTLRAIVTADVHAAFKTYAGELKQKLATLAAASWSDRFASQGSEQALENELQQLSGKEVAKIDDLLGLAGQTAAASPAQSARDDGQPGEDAPVSVPLVFRNIDPAALNLDDEQMQIIASLRQRFLEQIGGPNQNPEDPAYLARWQQSQPQIDNTLRSLLGNQVFDKYQMTP